MASSASIRTDSDRSYSPSQSAELVSPGAADKVKARQIKLDASSSQKIPNSSWGDRRRPKYPFPGLMKCGECGGGAIIKNQIHIGYANARNKGTCSNKHTIRRDHLEAAALDGL
jgi:hypothetical protein